MGAELSHRLMRWLVYVDDWLPGDIYPVSALKLNMLCHI